MRRFVMLTALVVPLSAHAAPMFVPLGDLPGGTFYSHANGVSADGSTVVGSSANATNAGAFRWTSQDGMTSLGTAEWGQANAASADGSTIVGGGYFELDTSEAFRWTSSEGMVPLGGVDAFAWAASADGSVIAGEGYPGTSGTEAFRWTSQDGMVGLGMLPGSDYSFAYGISADGSVIAGGTAAGGGLLEAFRWTSADGMVGLGMLPGDDKSAASAISADGSTIAGCSGSALSCQAVLWTSSGMLPLGWLPGLTDSTATALSADGSIVVGESYGPGGGGSAPFIWDATYGMRPLQEVLVALGVDLTGWQLTRARGISADGRTIVGQGVNPDGNEEAFLAFAESWAVPEPGTSVLLITGLVGLAVWRRRRA